MKRNHIDTWYQDNLNLIVKGQWQAAVTQLTSPPANEGDELSEALAKTGKKRLKITANNDTPKLNMAEMLSLLAGKAKIAELPRSIQDILDDWQSTYRAMQDFMLSGQSDNESEDMYQRLKERLIYICSLIARHHHLHSGLCIYSMCHSESLRHKDDEGRMGLTDELVLQLAECSERDEHYFALLDSLFNSIFTSAPLRDDNERVALEAIINSMEEMQMAYVISALTLSCHTFFCQHKLAILCHLAIMDDTPLSVRARALVGVMMVYNRFNHVADSIPLCRKAMQQVMDIDASWLEDMYEEWIMTSAAADLQTTIEGHIMPIIMKNANVQTDTFEGEGHQTHIIKIDASDPKNFKTTEQRNAFMHFVNLMKAGADTNYATFANMKRFDFFMAIAHWLLPFTPEHPMVKRVVRELDPSILNRIMLGTGLCASDMYSMGSMLNLTSGIARDGMLQSLSGGIMQHDKHTEREEEEEDNDENQAELDEILQQQLTLRRHIRVYLQDLFRLFTLHPGKEEMDNPFAKEGKGLAITPFWRPLMNDEIFLLPAARYYAGLSKHQEAIELYRRYLKVNPDNVEAMLELADSYVQTDAWRQAVEQLKLALLAGADEEHCLRKQAAVLMKARSYPALLQVLDRMIEIAPDDLQLQSTRATALMHNRSFNEAYMQYQAVAFTTDDPELRFTTQRGAAWCLFCMGRFNEALKAYDEFIDCGELHPEDLLNRAHSLWGLGRVAEAADCYLHHLRLMAREKHDGNNHLEMFDSDIPDLMAVTGITTQQVNVMRDYLLQQMSNEL